MSGRGPARWTVGFAPAPVVVCPVCGQDGGRPILELPALPVQCNVLWPTRQAALAAPRAELHLAHCPACGHVFNRTFDPGRVDYDARYENSLHHSPRFAGYAEDLAADLVARYDLHGRTIVEIACGQGDFLARLCRLGGNRGVGIDPAYAARQAATPLPPGVTIVAEPYRSQGGRVEADLICCRHALEHFPRPTDFLRGLRRALSAGGRTALYFEVPNALASLRAGAVWDFIYEHPSYFCAESLSRCFRQAGFTVLRVGEAFGGQFLGLEARPADPEGEAARPAPDAALLAEVAVHARRLRACLAARVEDWRARLAGADPYGKRLALWGAGSKGVTFLNLLQPGEQIAGIVDINPHKQGCFTAGTGHPILPPAALRTLQPHEVVVMNPLYAEEVAATLREVGCAARVTVA